MGVCLRILGKVFNKFKSNSEEISFNARLTDQNENGEDFFYSDAAGELCLKKTKKKQAKNLKCYGVSNKTKLSLKKNGIKTQLGLKTPTLDRLKGKKLDLKISYLFVSYIKNLPKQSISPALDKIFAEYCNYPNTGWLCDQIKMLCEEQRVYLKLYLKLNHIWCFITFQAQETNQLQKKNDSTTEFQLRVDKSIANDWFAISKKLTVLILGIIIAFVFLIFLDLMIGFLIFLAIVISMPWHLNTLMKAKKVTYSEPHYDKHLVQELAETQKEQASQTQASKNILTSLKQTNVVSDLKKFKKNGVAHFMQCTKLLIHSIGFATLLQIDRSNAKNNQIIQENPQPLENKSCNKTDNLLVQFPPHNQPEISNKKNIKLKKIKKYINKHFKFSFFKAKFIKCKESIPSSYLFKTSSDKDKDNIIPEKQNFEVSNTQFT